MITNDQIAEMEKVAAAATPGPWGYDLNRTVATHAPGDSEWGDTIVTIPPAWHVQPQDQADCFHIATFDPTTVKALLADLRASREQVERMRGVMEAKQAGSTAWVIEAGDAVDLYIGEVNAAMKSKPRHVYYNIGYVYGWQNALRFSRKTDAEIMLAHCIRHGVACNDGAKVAEHGFEEPNGKAE